MDVGSKGLGGKPKVLSTCIARLACAVGSMTETDFVSSSPVNVSRRSQDKTPDTVDRTVDEVRDRCSREAKKEPLSTQMAERKDEERDGESLSLLLEVSTMCHPDS